MLAIIDMPRKPQPRTDLPPCRHCKENAATRPRGLCRSCYYDLGIRAQYRSTSKYGLREGSDYKESLKRPADVLTRLVRDVLDERKAHLLQVLQPTDAIPGSEEKVRILIERAKLARKLRVSLFQPGDLGYFHHE